MNERLTAEMLRARVDAMTDAQVIWKACRHYNREEVQFLIPADRAGCGIGSFYDEDSNVYNYESFKVGTLNLRTERFSVDGGVEPTADELRRAAEGMRRSMLREAEEQVSRVFLGIDIGESDTADAASIAFYSRAAAQIARTPLGEFLHANRHLATREQYRPHTPPPVRKYREPIEVDRPEPLAEPNPALPMYDPV